MNKWLMLIVFIIPINSMASQRIITLGSDISEITYALGVGGNIVARDSASQHPVELKTLPDVGYLRHLNAEGILALQPTLVLCRAQASSSIALKQLTDYGVNVIFIPADTSPQTVINKIHLIATAVNKPEKGQQLINDYQQQLASIVSTPLPVKALFIISHAGLPPLAAGKGTAADTLFRLSGLDNSMQTFSGYRPLSQEGIIASAPDLLIVTSHSIKSVGGVDNIWRLPGVVLTPAGKKQRLLVLDDQALLGFGLQTPQVLKQLRIAGESSR
ncbi:heme/hemin ABC transporter substrate-binding protein [Yersinia aldovae]|uniref:heme/hemin ABC transporter substrate-binding protein n=1 Tax=Yersinia aldovae TaxID=29483 RepID=UPI0016436EBB|nr:ABC transporter substrate-binding protein [Yersinia aldovae]